jgi:rhodanese-related sulfurtransferase
MCSALWYRGMSLLSVLALAVTTLLCSCTAPPPSQGGGHNIDPQGLLSLLREKDAVIVDTMSRLECMDHRIPGSRCMALEEFDEKARAVLPDKQQTIVFYCESEECPRAGRTYEKAKAGGYGNIFVLQGGLSAWKSAGFEVETVERVKRAPVVSIKPDKLKEFVRQKKDLFILDIRSEDAFTAGHLESAVNIPLYLLHRSIGKIPKNRPVLVVDESGRRSFLACCYLVNNGVKSVTRLFGGMETERHGQGKKR